MLPLFRSISALILLSVSILNCGCIHEVSEQNPLQINQTKPRAIIKPQETVKPPVIIQPQATVKPQATARLKPPLNTYFRMIAQGSIEPARQQLQDFISENPDNGEARFLMGLSFHRQKRYALAKPYFEQATRLSPYFHPTFHFQGWCLYYLGEIDDSYNAFKEHLKLSPQEGDSIFGLGLIEMELDQLDQAESHFQSAIMLQKDNPRRVRDVAKIHARLGDIFIRRENYSQAEEELTQAVTLWPQHYLAYYKLYVVLNRLGKEQQAQVAYRLFKRGQAQAAVRRGVPGGGQGQ